MADRRARKVDFEAHFETVARQQRRALVAFDHFDRLEDFDDRLRHRLAAETGLVEQLHEGQPRTVHDRHFGTVQLGIDIVDTQRRKGGHDVFDRRHRHAGGVGDDGAQTGLRDVFSGGGDAVVAVGDIRTHEDDAASGRRRAHDHAHRDTGVKPHSGDNRRTAKGMFVLFRNHWTHPTDGSAPAIKKAGRRYGCPHSIYGLQRLLTNELVFPFVTPCLMFFN